MYEKVRIVIVAALAAYGGAQLGADVLSFIQKRLPRPWEERFRK